MKAWQYTVEEGFVTTWKNVRYHLSVSIAGKYTHVSTIRGDVVVEGIGTGIDDAVNNLLLFMYYWDDNDLWFNTEAE